MKIAHICKQLLFIHRELEVLVEHDPNAPDGGPNHDRHETLEAEWATLAEALTKTTPSTARKDVRALAELALMFAVRNDVGTFQDTQSYSFPDWLTLTALTAVARKPEAIPLPRYLPRYWPEKC